MVNKNSINISLLRIVAMLMVLSVHSGINSNWTKYTIAGQYGVTLFFTLSGYLILCSMEKKSCKEFYKKRILRIIPEYYTALIIYWLADFIKVFSEYNLSEINLTDVMGGHYLRYFTFTNMLLPSDNWYIWNNKNGWWTMSSFMCFYLVAPIIKNIINSFYKSLMALTLLLIVTPMGRVGLLEYLQNYFLSEKAHIEWFCEQTPVFQIYIFFFGITIYFAIRDKKQILYIIYLLFIFFAFNGNTYKFEIIITLCVMTVVQGEDIFLKPKLNKAVNYMARGSFSVYCIHGGVMSIISELVVKEMKSSVRFIIILISTCIICYIYYYIWERIQKRISLKLMYLSNKRKL